MRKKIVITILLIIFIIQTIIPVKVNAEPSNSELPTGQTGQNMGNNATVFDPDVTWDWVYEPKEYGLWVPSNAEMIENAPMIVWLPGMGDGVDGTENGLKMNGLSELISNWKNEGFSAFILCPHSSHNGISSWDGESASRLAEIIDKVILQYPIDPTNVVIIGRSAGAKGALQMARDIPEYFSKVVALSGYYVSGLNTITRPIKCYVGTLDLETCQSDMTNYLEPAFGEENCIWLEGADHKNIVEKAFYDDSGQYMGIARKWTF